MSNRSGDSLFGPIISVIGAIAVLAGIIWGIYWELGPKLGLHDTTITVCRMEDSKSDDQHQYRVYANVDGQDETFKMDDSWTGVKRRNTADDYSKMTRQISAGPVTYDVTVKGERWNTPTNFPNIVKFTKAAKQTPELCSATAN